MHGTIQKKNGWVFVDLLFSPTEAFDEADLFRLPVSFIPLGPAVFTPLYFNGVSYISGGGEQLYNANLAYAKLISGGLLKIWVQTPDRVSRNVMLHFAYPVEGN